MSLSFTFNGIDMSAYGLTVMTHDASNLAQENESQLIQDLSWPFRPKKPPKPITLQVSVKAADRATLKSYLDSIKQVITTEIPCNLILDSLDNRYWLAKMESVSKGFHGPKLWQGTIIFKADDPVAYATSETSSDFSIDADPKTVNEAVAGTGYVSPVYTLTAGEDLTDATIIVANLTTDETLTWEGSLSNGEELAIDVAHWIVKVEGVASMSGLDSTSKFPRLAPGETNQIRITGFSTTGSLNITYRERYL